MKNILLTIYLTLVFSSIHAQCFDWQFYSPINCNELLSGTPESVSDSTLTTDGYGIQYYDSGPRGLRDSLKTKLDSVTMRIAQLIKDDSLIIGNKYTGIYALYKVYDWRYDFSLERSKYKITAIDTIRLDNPIDLVGKMDSEIISYNNGQYLVQLKFVERIGNSSSIYFDYLIYERVLTTPKTN
jgi:hypothetical protein